MNAHPMRTGRYHSSIMYLALYESFVCNAVEPLGMGLWRKAACHHENAINFNHCGRTASHKQWPSTDTPEGADTGELLTEEGRG